MTKRVLLLGGTGAIGMYLVPELLARGFRVDVTTRAARDSDNQNLKYIQGNAHDPEFLRKTLLRSKYDAIADFMNYPTDEFRSRCELLLKNCEHYVFLSSYRVFADTKVITEESPRLLDISTDKEYLKTDDYSLAKARQEDILRGTSKKNWTIVRPAITYSSARFQLGTMEIDTLVWRALHKLPVILPHEMLNKITTMTWAGDVARLIAKLVLFKKAMSEDFNIATSEHHTWSEVAEMYGKIVDLKIQPVGLEEYIAAMGGGFNNYQVKYDRMFNRILDNSKVLRVTGEEQRNFTKLHDGLRLELTRFIENPHFERIDYAKQAKFDKLAHVKINLSETSPEEKHIYQELRFPRKTKLRRTLRPRTRLRSVRRKLRPRTRLKSLMQGTRDLYVHRKTKRADGAILTLTGYYNYGNIIQRYSLQQFLRQRGYRFISYWGQPFGMSGTEFDRFRYTAGFVKKCIWLKPFDPLDDFRLYIVGSDQVWRNWGYSDENKELGYYFFNFVLKQQTKRIVYAASFGQDNINNTLISQEFLKYVKPLIKKIDYISMRESSGVKIMQDKWKVKAQHVLDPTMLLTVDDYNELIRKSPYKLNETKQIFAYILEVNSKKEKIIKDISYATKMEVDRIHPYQLDVLPPVEQWLEGFRDAELVVTDSFHGAVFAIINNTPFVVIENLGGGVTRVTGLLEQFGLENRLVAENEADTFDLSKLKPIDWREVNSKVKQLRDQSADWLLNAIEKPKSQKR
jgi:nucleoside-diphosphate-sugar epimerase